MPLQQTKINKKFKSNQYELINPKYSNIVQLVFVSVIVQNLELGIYINIVMQASFSEEKTLTISKVIYNYFKAVYQQQRLDPQHLEQFKKQHLKPLYPHKQDELGQARKYYCCEACTSSPGSFCCCNSYPPEASYVNLGLGICLYFKFLKHSTVFYMLMSLIAILSCVVCFAVSIQNGFNPLADYTTFFFSSTYGPFSSQHNKCQYGLISNNQTSLTLRCPYGQINAFGSVLSDQSHNSLLNCRNQRKKQQSGQTDYSTSTAVQSQSCDSTMSNCVISIQFPTSPSYPLVSYTYQCINNVYKIGSIHGDSRYYFYFIVIVDLFFCICYFFFLCSQNIAETKQQEFFKASQVSLNDFSVQIQGFSRNTYESQFKQLMNEYTKMIGPTFFSSVVSYSFPEGEQMMDFQSKQKDIYQELYDLVKEYYFQSQGPMLSFQESHELMLQRKSKHMYDQYKTNLKQLVDRYMNLRRKEVFNEYKNSKEKISLYLVFTDVLSKQGVLNRMQNYCCGQKLVIQNRSYYIKEPPIPDLIQWQNRPRWTFCRSIFSWLLTILICVGSYLLFGFIQYKQNQLFSDYNYGIDCGILYTSSQLSTFNSTLNAQSTSYLTCVCKQNIFDSNKDYCSSWRSQYLLYLAIPLLISLGIVVYNIIVCYIFKALSQFQKHEFVTNQQLSYTLKRAFVLIMNMGLIMILLNYNYQNSTGLQQISFVFLGKFDSFSSDWYMNIGAIIILTLIFNIAFPIIQLLFACIIKFLKRCWDKRCCCVTTSRQSKKDYISLYSDQIFSVSERYAYLIATLIVSLGFSGIVPILTPVAAISFFLLYHADKLLMFKFFQTPVNYDHSLHQIVIKTMIIGLIGHFALTAYFLTEPTLLAANSSIPYPNSYTPNSGSSRINTMITTSYIIPYVVLFVLIILFLIINNIIKSLCEKIKDFCIKKLDIRTSKIRQLIFWDCLNRQQVDDLIQITEVNIQQQELRRSENLTNTISNSDKLVQEQINTQQNILKAALHLLKLKKRQISEAQLNPSGTRLIGLPSYQHLNKSIWKKQYDEMLKLQKLLRDVVRNSSISQRLQPTPKGVSNQSADYLIQRF